MSVVAVAVDDGVALAAAAGLAFAADDLAAGLAFAAAGLAFAADDLAAGLAFAAAGLAAGLAFAAAGLAFAADDLAAGLACVAVVFGAVVDADFCVPGLLAVTLPATLAAFLELAALAWLAARVPLLTV